MQTSTPNIVFLLFWLLNALVIWSSIMAESWSYIDTVYDYFAKTLDDMDFMVTLQNLKELGINGSLEKQLVINMEYPKNHCMAHCCILMGDIYQSVFRAFPSNYADVATSHPSKTLSFSSSTLILCIAGQQGTT